MHVPQTEVILRYDGAELARVTLPPGEYVIGCNPDVQIFADTPLISRRHARLTINYDHALIEDLGSSNGTFVNEQPLAETTRLFPNQAVRLGPDITVEIHRQRTPTEPGVSLAPAQQTIRRFLPDEVLADRRYAIGKVVAQGGMGAILDAQQAAMRRQVAMKVMLESAEPADVARFVEEAQVTGQLAHPNIVPVYELGVDENDQLFYTMKMVRGITLKKVLGLIGDGVEATAKKYPLPALLTIFQKVCDAIAFAHSKGVIHRDLKPENIMLDDFGVVLVMDWGLAKVIGAARTRGEILAGSVRHSTVHSARAAEAELGGTMAGSIMGTPQYMAPEQARGEIDSLDARTDLYALGAILYTILALRPPVTGRNVHEVIDKVARGEIDPLDSPQRHKGTKGEETGASFVSSSLRGHLPGGRIPDSLAAVVRKAMALEPAQRYARVEDLQADLLAYQTGFATSAEQAGWWKRATLAIKRHKIASLGIAAVLLVGGIFGTKAVVEGRRAERALGDLKKNAPSLLALAESEAAFQRFDSALVKLDAALALDPALTAGWWRRVWLLLGMARYGEAPAAFRTAQQRDPAQHAHDALFRHFTKVGASGELNALSQRLTLGAKQKEQMVRQRLDEWLGKNMGVVTVQTDGTIEVKGLPKATDTLEPLRGLPVGSLNVSFSAVKSLEPLRGMMLTYLSIGTTRISDLSPLRGMPIAELHADGSGISNLNPLAGMPLRIFTAPGTKITDISPLRGAPLEDLNVLTNRVLDFSSLRAAPLRSATIGGNQCPDLSFLTDSPALEYLQCGGNGITDLSPLRGKPLKFLEAGNNRITDLRPLAGLPLTELSINGNPIADYAPLRGLRQLQKLRISGLKFINISLEPLRQHPSLQYIALGGDAPYRPVAEFWADYDTPQAAGKK